MVFLDTGIAIDFGTRFLQKPVQFSSLCCRSLIGQDFFNPVTAVYICITGWCSGVPVYLDPWAA